MITRKRFDMKNITQKLSNEQLLEHEKLKQTIKPRNILYFNIIMSISLLKPPWFILVSSLVVLIEALVLSLFWKNLKQALGIAVAANLGSAIIALPLIHTCFGEGSLWFYLIVLGENRVTEGLPLINDLSVILLFISFMGIALFFSIVMEIMIGKTLNAPEKRLHLSIIVANIITYSIIIASLLGLGLWYGLTKQDPSIEAWGYFEGKLVEFVPIDTLLAGFQMLILFAGGGIVCVSLILSIIIYLKKELTERSTQESLL
jgi:hypothetical protein